MGILVSWITGKSSWASSSAASSTASSSSSSSSSSDSLLANQSSAHSYGASNRAIAQLPTSPGHPADSVDGSFMPDTPVVSRHRAFVSSYFEAGGSAASSSSAASPSSPSAPQHAGVDMSANEAFPTQEVEMSDAADPQAGATPAPDVFFEGDESLSVLEKIYLYSVSNASFHKHFIAQSLSTLLPEVDPAEATEYVIPLLNGLALDEDESVREALVQNLEPVLWWFLTTCEVVEHDLPEISDTRQVPPLGVQTFTPLLVTLLLNPSREVGGRARTCIMSLLTRIRDVNEKGLPAGNFGPQQRRIFEREIMQQIVIGMAHLENTNSASSSSDSESRSTAPDPAPLGSADARKEVLPISPPLSAADDTTLLPTLNSASLATSQIVAMDEKAPKEQVLIASLIPRPPSPLPSSPVLSSLRMPDATPDVTSPPAHLHPSNHLKIDQAPLSGVEGPEAPEDMASALLQPLPQSQSNHSILLQESESLQEVSEEQSAYGRVASMSLIATVTSSGLPDDSFKLSFVDEVQRASRDPVFWVRREATFALGALMKVVPEEIVHAFLVPIFSTLSEDPIWNVRQSILFSLPALLSRLPLERKSDQALRTIRRAFADSQQEVRTGALEVLGEVIYSFHGDEPGPPEDIVRLFIGEEGRDWHHPESSAFDAYVSNQAKRAWASSILAARIRVASTHEDSSGTSTPISPHSGSDPARPLICAFNLPAVIVTLGRTRWEELRGLYVFLAKAGAVNVRQTLAASIGEVARVLGPELAGRDLVPRWWDFARSRDAVVRRKAVESLDLLLQVVDVHERMQIAASLVEAWSSSWTGWREREVFAGVFPGIANALVGCSPTAVRTLVSKMLRDPYATVRNAAVLVFPRIRRIAVSYPDALRLLDEEVNSLSSDSSFKKRLMFIEAQSSLLKQTPLQEVPLDKSFWSAISRLSRDKILDVRIAVARLISLIYAVRAGSAFPPSPGLSEIVTRLSQDPSSDVRSFVSFSASIAARGDAPDHSPTDPTSVPTVTIFSRPPPSRRSSRVVAGMTALSLDDPDSLNARRHAASLERVTQTNASAN